MELQVLIVDSEKFSRKIIETQLEKINVPMKIHQAADAIDALKILESGRIHILFIDVELPVLSGFVVLSKLRESGLAKDLKIVVISRPTKETLQKLRSSKVGAYLQKPIEAKAFADLVQRSIYGIFLLRGFKRLPVERLLLICSDASFINFFVKTFGKTFSVEIAETAEQGASVNFLQRNFDVILIDEGIEEDWKQAALKIREVAYLPPPAMYVLTDKDLAEKSTALINGLLRKSFDSGDLVNAFVSEAMSLGAERNRQVLSILKLDVVGQFKQQTESLVNRLARERMVFELTPGLSAVPDVQAVVILDDVLRGFELAVSVSGVSDKLIYLVRNVFDLPATEGRPQTKQSLLRIATTLGEMTRRLLAGIHIDTTVREAEFSSTLENRLSYEWAAVLPFQDSDEKYYFFISVGVLGSRIRSDYV